MTINGKEIKVNQYYSVNGHVVQVTQLSSLDVWYRILGWPDAPLMVCDRGVFCAVAKEGKK